MSEVLSLVSFIVSSAVVDGFQNSFCRGMQKLSVVQFVSTFVGCVSCALGARFHLHGVLSVCFRIFVVCSASTV